MSQATKTKFLTVAEVQKKVELAGYRRALRDVLEDIDNEKFSADILEGTFNPDELAAKIKARLDKAN